jgi:hypothetical protein
MSDPEVLELRERLETLEANLAVIFSKAGLHLEWHNLTAKAPVIPTPPPAVPEPEEVDAITNINRALAAMKVTDDIRRERDKRANIHELNHK